MRDCRGVLVASGVFVFGLLFLTACGGAQRGTEGEETISPVERLETVIRSNPAYVGVPISIDVVAGGWSQGLPPAPSIEPGFLPLSPSEVAEWNLERFVDYPLSKQAQCVARMQLAYFHLFGRLIPFPFESMVHYSCGNTVPRVTYERFFLCEDEDFSGWPGLTDEETAAQERDRLTSDLEWDFEEVGGELSRREFARQHCEQLAANPVDTGADEQTVWSRHWGATEQPWREVQNEQRLGTLPSHRETATQTWQNRLWATVSEYDASSIAASESVDNWFSERHFGIACLEAVNGVIECIEVMMHMPDRFVLDPVRPSGIGEEQGYWLHGWTGNELLSATMAGIGVQAGACRIRQIRGSGEFFIGCPAPQSGQIGVLHLTCSRDLMEYACLSIRVSEGDTARAWSHPLLQEDPSMVPGSTNTYGSLEYSRELAELLADAREQNGLPRPEVLYNQIEAMNQWAMTGEPTAMASAMGILDDAVEQGHGVGWPIGLARASLHDTRLATPRSMAVEVLQSAAAAGLYEGWVDGIAVMIVPCTFFRTGCEEGGYGVMVAVYQRVTDPTEAEARILNAWQEARARIGLSLPPPPPSWISARFRAFERRLDRTKTPRQAFVAMMNLPLRQVTCNFRVPERNGDFGEMSMLVRDDVWIRPVVYEGDSAGEWEIEIAGQMMGGCPQR